MFKNNLQRWLQLAKKESRKGELPLYIPLLAEANPDLMAIAIHRYFNNDQGEQIAAGDINQNFPLMSVIKPFLLLYLLETQGLAPVLAIVDRQPTSDAFNEIPHSKPKNPMINSGAIALCSLLPSYEILQNWLNQRSGANLTLDLEMLNSVRSVPNRRNLAIAEQLNSLGIIAYPRQALAVYEEICCLRGNVQDLAKLGTLLIDPKLEPVRSPHIQIVLDIMTQCGMYGASAAFAHDIGLPSKSSVSGALLSIIPNQAAIACYSPALDAIGNSVAGLFLIRQIKTSKDFAIK